MVFQTVSDPPLSMVGSLCLFPPIWFDSQTNTNSSSIFRGKLCPPNHHHRIYCLFVLRLNIQVNSISVMLRQSHRFLGITSTFLKCLAQGHNTGEVGFEPPFLPDLSLRTLARIYHSVQEIASRKTILVKI